MIRRYVRLALAQGPTWGVIAGDDVRLLAGNPTTGSWTETRDVVPLAGSTLLAPATPSKILAVGRNYRSHLHGRPAPERPELFFKPPSAIVGPDEAIVLPPDAENTHCEGELVVVMGRQARNVSVEAALDYVFGYTCGNDVSTRDWQNHDLQWWRAKGCDTYAPVGPWIATGLDPRAETLTTRLGAEVVQQGPLSDLLFDVPTVISFASRYLTLEPGDLIYTGTPGSTRAMQSGEIVTVEVSGIGALSNPVRRA